MPHMKPCPFCKAQIKPGEFYIYAYRRGTVGIVDNRPMHVQCPKKESEKK